MYADVAGQTTSANGSERAEMDDLIWSCPDCDGDLDMGWCDPCGMLWPAPLITDDDQL